MPVGQIVSKHGRLGDWRVHAVEVPHTQLAQGRAARQRRAQRCHGGVVAPKLMHFGVKGELKAGLVPADERLKLPAGGGDGTPATR